ncbi:hypothetical protein Bbelb_360090 [Branchiostoma belcheri]|nr:hypothetical protein Bbelb_360090 [Branchiostoma belcheri]
MAPYTRLTLQAFSYISDEIGTSLQPQQLDSTSVDHVLQIIAEGESLTDKTFPVITTGQYQSADNVVKIIAEHGQTITSQEPSESLTDKTFTAITTGQYQSTEHVLPIIAEGGQLPSTKSPQNPSLTKLSQPYQLDSTNLQTMCNRSL